MSYEPLSRTGELPYASPVPGTGAVAINVDPTTALLNGNVAYGFNQPRDSEILIKVRYRNGYREFRTANNVSMLQLSSELAQHMSINQANASLGTAYLLWLVFGMFGIHRWYLGKHNSLSWFIWFITGQLFGLGWLWDGFTLWRTVRDYNSRGSRSAGQSDFLGLGDGWLDDYEPNVFVAYLLWFFCGFLGIHRWYTHTHTAGSFLAWFCTAQMCFLGWLADIGLTYRCCKHGRRGYQSTFVVKVQDLADDYVPVFTDQQLHTALTHAARSRRGAVRLSVHDSKDDGTAHLLWFFFGVFGAHYYYLAPNIALGDVLARVLTGNYFVIGWIVEGIMLSDTIENANRAYLGQFSPSAASAVRWPSQGWFGVGVSTKDVDV